MPARSRAGSRLRSGSPPRALRLPLEALRSADAPRTSDTDGAPDAGSELGPGSSAPTAEGVGTVMTFRPMNCELLVSLIGIGFLSMCEVGGPDDLFSILTHACSDEYSRENLCGSQFSIGVPLSVEEEMAGLSQLCIRRWTTKHVAVWLKDEGFFEYVDVLCNKHRLDGITLLTLTEYDLRSPPLEIKVLGDIKRLMLSVRKLQKIHIDVLEEMGYNSDSPMSPMTPFISALQSADWLCNGEPTHDCDGPITDLNSEQYQYMNGKNKHSVRRLDPEYWKTILSCVYVFIVFGFTSFIMVIVHERVPDMQTYPPLPDIFLDSVPRIPWAFSMTEVCGMILCYIWILVLLLHKHRSILLRRLCSLMGTVFLLRCFTMFVTSLSVPGQHLQCTGKIYGSVWEKLHRAFAIWSGFGMTLTGVHTCGDYMFSGHTVVLTMLNFFVTEYFSLQLFSLPASPTYPFSYLDIGRSACY
ncbi:hypothetical protein STEG23_023960 [Scotinomys teguina]